MADCEGPALGLPEHLSARAQPALAVTRDQEWADLARRVPGGFGGIDYDRDSQQVVLLLVHPSRATEARKALAPAVLADTTATQVRRARWDFAQLVDWNRFLLGQVLRGPERHLVSLSNDVTLNRIRVGVRDSSAARSVMRQLEAVPIPCDLVHLEVIAPYRWE